MFKFLLTAVLTSTFITGCAPTLSEPREDFPQGVWNIDVETNRELDQVSIDGGVFIVNARSVTTYTKDVANECFVKWPRVATDDTYTSTLDGETIKFHGSDSDDEFSFYVVKDGQTAAWKYIEASLSSDVVTVTEFEEQQNICD